MNQQEVLERLKSGNNNFVDSQLTHKLNDGQRRSELTGGQAPFAIVLGCADSRVVPELVFDTGLGELFVVRVAGNIANTDSIASIEYAVAHCGVKVIVVLGHEACGAVTAAIAGGDNGKNLNHLLGQIEPVVKSCGEGAELTDVIKKNAEAVASNLKTESSILSAALEKGELTIAPAYYNLGSGAVDFLS